jgi:hypothetical protein
VRGRLRVALGIRGDLHSVRLERDRLVEEILALARAVEAREREESGEEPVAAWEHVVSNS